MVDIPDVLYRTKDVNLGGNTVVQIKGHRGSDFAILKALNKVESKTMKLTIKLNQVTTEKDKDGNLVNKLDSELDDKEIEELLNLREQIEDLQGEARPLIHKLAQRGLKRYFYPDLTTKELDEKPDIEINEGEKLGIHRAMDELDRPLKILDSDDEGKP
jgi:hypothetical protein